MGLGCKTLNNLQRKVVKDWRERRELAYLFQEFDDYNLPHDYIYLRDDELADLVIGFFVGGSQLIFPAKSYFVAIIYAHLLSVHFKVPFYEALDQEDLLLGDKYFVRYSDHKNVYDKIIEGVGNIWECPSIRPTVDYFNKEFLIE